MDRELQVRLSIHEGKGSIDIIEWDCGDCVGFVGEIGSPEMREWVADEIVSWLEMMQDEQEDEENEILL